MQKSPVSKVPKPASEPPSPSLSRTSSPPASDGEDEALDDEHGEVDSEDERLELMGSSRGGSGVGTPFSTSPAESLS